MMRANIRRRARCAKSRQVKYIMILYIHMQKYIYMSILKQTHSKIIIKLATFYQIVKEAAVHVCTSCV